MNAFNIKTIAVLGAGTMGQGIAQVCAQAGYTTLLFDVSPDAAKKAIERIQEQVKILVAKGKMTSAQQKIIEANLISVTSFDELRADLIIEAVVEKLEVKQAIFLALEKINPPSSIFATNTSSLSVSNIGSVLQYQERFVGIHFFNPAPIMPLVEIIPGTKTDGAIPEVVSAMLKVMGKHTVLSKDTPGFIVNRVARHFYLESLKLLQEKTSDEKGIDALLRSAGFRMGPFELMDLIGIDINYAVSVSVYNAFDKAARFEPNAIQHQKIALGHFGRKTGQGFYTYEK